MTKDTTLFNNSTIAEVQEGEYFPPVSIAWDKDGRSMYLPVHYEKKLVQYDISVGQYVYSDGRFGATFFKIRIDNSKNIIKDRFEILDL